MMSNSNQLVIGVSSRALFDLDESHMLYEQEGLDSYSKYQIENENRTLEPGTAYSLVQNLLDLKKDEEHLVEVVLVSRNSADTGLRIFNSIEEHNLRITRASFSGGAPPYPYLSAFGCHLFLSGDQKDVRNALVAEQAAAQMLSTGSAHNHNDEIRIAFDGDAVLFSDESERIYQEHGLDAFIDHEQETRNEPMKCGPFKGFLEALHKIQNLYPANQSPFRTALVTARSAPTHERVIHTLRSWDIRIDESLFLGGMKKGDFLRAFQADIFFDDQRLHLENASPDITTGHVVHGVTNE